MTGEWDGGEGQRTNLTGVVLAGGDSTRFGPTPKATARLAGRPLVDRVTRRLWRVTGRAPVVAARSDEQRELVDAAVSVPVRFAPDADWCAGPLAGLAGSVDAVETDHLFVCGCDMPLLAPAAVTWQARRLADSAAEAVVPMDDEGYPQLLHAAYDRAALGDVFEDRPADDRLRLLLDRLSVERVGPAGVTARVSMARSTTNVNTRGELAALAAGEAGTRGTDGGEPNRVDAPLPAGEHVRK
ncbi:molybdenum cofactor guanylyltransferase [Haloarchaeobius amylolyticus]|uniref:molybdenum cofactor guanylyltransferase n=1 Tax=Haloarchaeobius amylolyticus TaxID=1198296 RepID=UPI0022720FC1|nr:molybdenum cofactor guanylyltransferase [Haloarchaeobius amylolyticus]